MPDKKKLNDKYIPEPDELEEETDYDVDRGRVLTTGRVDFPNVEDEYNTSFESDVAQQVGRFSDQVHLGSPAAEAGEIGQGAQKDIIEASKKRLAEKMKKREQK